ncbi:glucose-6-phosphate 1-dehydrogenase, putative [Theileria equi strain WA]|uniref:glucose-6-phosphate dehydrogenase (NADP(+)) n=1 Tax=Theileria equi strain WA TaxID=1537102 RepID=L1LBP1_THEEQ|nr:glucose-6-phosphate 1-dehydrogenase, putative [Theileria equi strain WA]EKX72685.1 glucose-6-phosphate 1-dehydrogenase, putative [Theileria equi strain WA]|eukprot:XP_004832137.1 glucose-6-phosphate 1-dehydrogenase, putative [Theileria equi strain WA]
MGDSESPKYVGFSSSTQEAPDASPIPIPATLSRRIFKGNPNSDSYSSMSNLLASSCSSDYDNWIKGFYASRINEILQFKSTSHVITPPCDNDCTDVDDIIEPCLLDCHTEEGFVKTATHLILHKIRTKQAKSPTSMVTIGLSGGSTPREIFSFMGRLQDLEIDFNRIIIFVVDERYVPTDDEMSNIRLIRNTLLKYWPIPESNIIFPDTSLPLEECVKKYEEDLEKIFGVVNINKVKSEPGDDSNPAWKAVFPIRPDLITLGIGADFHIAGLFPEYLSTLDAAYVTDCVHRVMVTYTETAVVRERITLSLPFLCCAKSKLFLLKGERKKRIWTTMIQYRHVDPIRFPATQIFTRPGCIAVLDSSTIRKVRLKIPLDQTDYLTFLLFGSTGDLARKKLYPALFHLFYLGFLPNKFHILAISRYEEDFDAFFNKMSEDIFASINTNLYLRDPAVRFDYPTVISEFKNKCSRIKATYSDPESIQTLMAKIAEIEAGAAVSHRMVYLATPAEAYEPIMKMVTSCCKPKNGWFRVLLEKPFGRDLSSSLSIQAGLNKYIEPEKVFLIDHYLGKPVVACIISSKKSPRYSPLFNRKYVKSVHIKLKEEIGSFGRSYFESYGIIRDMIQNHGLQLLSLIAMNHTSGSKKSIAQDKLNVLKCIRTVTFDDAVIGQYTDSLDGKKCAYRKEPGISQDSLCNTYCSCVMWIDNDDWRDVPFIITAGKGLDERLCEVSLNVHENEIEEFCEGFKPNKLVYRVHPDPSVFWAKGSNEIDVGEVKENAASDVEAEATNKEERILRDVEYTATKRTIEGAYEILFYHAFSGRKDSFPTIDEANESWRILTPLIDEIAEKKVVPIFYPRGSAGPGEANRLFKLLS